MRAGKPLAPAATPFEGGVRSAHVTFVLFACPHPQAKGRLKPVTIWL